MKMVAALAVLFVLSINIFDVNSQLFNRHLGFGINHPLWDEFYPFSYEPIPFYYQLVRNNNENDVNKIENNKDSWKIHLDVRNYKPDEINVTLQDNFIKVSAQHEEKSDNQGFVSRQFVRRYSLPKDVDDKTITSEISKDSVLIIKALKNNIPENENEKKIEIKQTSEVVRKPQQKPAAEEKKVEESTTNASGADESSTPTPSVILNNTPN